MMQNTRPTRPRTVLALLVLSFVLLGLGGCPPVPSLVGNLAGTVTNSLTGSGISGVSVVIDPAIEGTEITTGENGTYSQELPTGIYALTFESDGYESQTIAISVVGGATTTVDVALVPTETVVLSVDVEGDAVPGASVTATVTVEILDGSTTVSGYSWAQSNSVDVSIAGGTTATATVTLPALSAYKDELFMILAEPPIEESDLPPNIHLPEGEFPGGIQDRFQVVGLDPHALEEAGLVTLEVTVTTSSGTYTEEAEIHTELPWKVSTGVHNVPIGVPVLLHGKTQDAYNWRLSTRPSGSSATLRDAASQNPYFTPDVAGLYATTVRDEADPNDPNDVDVPVTLEIYAGTWVGAITGQDADGRPLAANCTVCHNGTIAEDMFTPWAQTGHAEIFTDSLNTSDHYSPSCFACHTVGFDTDVDNGGIDDAGDYQEFLDDFTSDGSHIIADADNWTNLLASADDTAQLANIQCENCHGPQNGGAHTMEEPRISIASNVCGSCHGEPARHGRFQQWQLSAHANYELAIDEGESGNCSRCHTGNGFLAWSELDPPFDPDTSVTADWDADEVHPQTCVVCHDPHDVGSTTGEGTDAQPRITGNTPPLTDGFVAYGVGKGAICMTCHSSRRGLRNDDTWPDTSGSDPGRAPHGAAQTAVLMGENAYLVEVGIRASHALIEDTCVNCHMRATDPPDLLSYNLGGTNHTFFASDDICAECHGELVDAESLEGVVEASLDALLELIEDAILDEIEEQIAAGNTIDLDGQATITDAAEVADIEFGESHGRQAITVTFTDGTVVEHVQMRDVTVLDGTATELGALYDAGFADSRLPRAGWNWLLINNDGSKGAHNPPFVNRVLDASIDALNDILAE